VASLDAAKAYHNINYKKGRGTARHWHCYWFNVPCGARTWLRTTRTARLCACGCAKHAAWANAMRDLRQHVDGYGQDIPATGTRSRRQCFMVRWPAISAIHRAISLWRCRAATILMLCRGDLRAGHTTLIPTAVQVRAGTGGKMAVAPPPIPAAATF